MAESASFNIDASLLNEGLELLRSLGRIVPLEEIVARLAAGQHVRGLFAVTFDDAYAGLADLALPVLRRHAAPATIFAVSGALLAGDSFWWDRIEDLHSHIPAGRWQQFEHDLGLPPGYGTSEVAEYGTLRPLRQWMLGRFQGRQDIIVSRLLDALEHEVGYRTTMRSMRTEELRELARDPLIAVASHTVTHAALSQLSDADARAEIAQAHADLRATGFNPLPLFAAPYGMGDARTISLAREAGMTAVLGTASRTLGGARIERPIPRFVMSSARRGARLGRQLAGTTDFAKRILGRTEPDWPARPAAAGA